MRKASFSTIEKSNLIQIFLEMFVLVLKEMVIARERINVSLNILSNIEKPPRTVFYAAPSPIPPGGSGNLGLLRHNSGDREVRQK